MQHASLLATAAAKPAPLSTEEALRLLGHDGADSVADAAVDEAVGALELHGSSALWFKKEAFSAANFDPDAYVKDVQRYVPLDALRSALETHLGTLKNELLELINRDYADFVSLSTQLTDVDGSVERMRAPLLTLRGRVSAARDAAAGQLAALAAGLQRRTELAEKRSVLQLCVDAASSVAKVERLLSELEAAERASGGEEGEAAEALLERCGAEATRVALFCARGGAAGLNLPFIATLTPRVKAAQSQLGARLGNALRRALDAQPADHGAACRRLAAFASAHDAHAAVKLLSELLVRKLVREAFAEPPLKPGAGTAEGEAAAASRLLLASGFAALRQGLEPHAPILFAQPGAIGEEKGGAAAADALRCMALGARSVLAETLALLAEKRSDAFSAGRPLQFRANHAECSAFCAWLAKCARVPVGGAGAGGAAGGGAQTGRLGVAGEEGGAEYALLQAALLKKFNLPAYFSLRFQEIAAGLEALLTSGKGALEAPPAAAAAAHPSPLPAPTHPFNTAAAAGSLAALGRPWAEDVYLPPLADKLLALSLQCASRFAVWCVRGAAARERQEALAAAASTSTDPSASDPASAAAAQLASRGAEPLSSVPSGPAVDWALSASPEDMLLLSCDCEALGALLSSPNTLPPLLARRLPPSAAAREAAAQAFVSAGEGVAAAALPLRRLAASALAERCCEVLRQLKGITATFRLTNKPSPVRHSHFVPAVTAPLRAFLDSPRLAGGAVGPQAKHELALQVAELVTGRYLEMARELVTTVRKTESSLKRLKDRRTGAAPPASAATGGGAEVSDTDKICKQLLLDCAEYGRGLARFGIDAAQQPSFLALWAVVAPDTPLSLAAP